ncbi:hypothetical protein FB451DRAFT_1217571 [Mycena latifolia]|nr:hypothetical protein FB451DRAFT_1217571 [Mycena latifolia]
MSSFMPGAGAAGHNLSYYPNAIYQESVFTPKPPPFNGDNGTEAAPSETTESAPRECSVRGCLNPLEPPGPNAAANKKMCAACREKHRAYASTKRARRKAEKTLVSKMSATAPGTQLPDAEQAPWANQESSPSALGMTVTQYSSPISAASTPSVPQSQPLASVRWSHAIDPALYSQPSGSSSSSTLAGALTLPASASAPPNNFSSDPSADPPFSSSSFPARDADAGGSLNAQGVGHIQSQSQIESAALASPGRSGIDTSGSGAPASDGAVGVAPQVLNGRPRFCSVKGCKAIILESMEAYLYRMCKNCRTRYRQYGITKRAKWKAEREAYDKELDGLRAKEDIRRAANGLPPLADSPDELQAWELSIIDEQVPLPPSHQSTSRESVPMPMGPLDTRYSRQVPSEVPLPARMCTVSHCHKILPGFYRYKRCETHRIQNRWHSKLKRGREKIEKGFMLPDGTPIVLPGPIRPKKSAEPKEKKPRKKREVKGKETETIEGAPGPSTGGENIEGGEAAPNQNNDRPEKPIPKRSKNSTTCKEDGCSNLIMPGTRWRACDSCRVHNRTLKQEKKAAEKVQAAGSPFVNITVDTHHPEVGPTIPDLGVTSNLGATAASGSGSGSTAATADVSTSPVIATTYPPGYTSTSTLLTVIEPPSDKSEVWFTVYCVLLRF